MSIAKKNQILLGTVISNKMSKTAVVLVANKRKQPLYGKYVMRKQKIMAHTENNSCKEGDRVVIKSCRPISKNKSWTVIEVLNA